MTIIPRMIDEIDATILDMLQSNARVSNADIARAVGMAPSAVLERVRKLEERGYIRGYEADLDPALLGCGLLAYIFVRGDDPPGVDDLSAGLAAIEEVQEVHHVAGEDCYLAKVRVADTAALGALLRDRIGALPYVRSTRSTIVLDTIKQTARVPIDPARESSQS